MGQDGLHSTYPPWNGQEEAPSSFLPYRRSRVAREQIKTGTHYSGSHLLCGKFSLKILYATSIITLVSKPRHLVKGKPKKIHQIRKRLGLSQAEFGELLGVAGNTVARWERGELVPPKVAELAAAYLLLTHKKGDMR